MKNLRAQSQTEGYGHEGCVEGATACSIQDPVKGYSEDEEYEKVEGFVINLRNLKRRQAKIGGEKDEENEGAWMVKKSGCEEGVVAAGS